MGDDAPRRSHGARFRNLGGERYPRRVAEVYGGDLARAAADTDEQVAATVAAWEREQGIEPTDWQTIGDEFRAEQHSGDVLRVGIGSPEEPFAPPWRFWTYRDSAYLSLRTAGAIFKASYHPATPEYESALWTFGFTSESGAVFTDTGRRRSHTWQQGPEIMPGWYPGPSIAVPRLPDREYDLPPTEGLEDVLWVAAPAVGHMRSLTVFLTDGRPDLPPFPLREGEAAVGELPMTNGWHVALATGERPLQDHERPPLENLRDETRLGVSRAGGRGSESASIVWVTTSPSGPPLLVQIVLGADNFYEDDRSTPPEGEG